MVSSESARVRVTVAAALSALLAWGVACRDEGIASRASPAPDVTQSAEPKSPTSPSAMDREAISGSVQQFAESETRQRPGVGAAIGFWFAWRMMHRQGGKPL